jgi:hypothetical protein
MKLGRNHAAVCLFAAVLCTALLWWAGRGSAAQMTLAWTWIKE